MTSNFKCSFEALNDLKTYFDVNNQNFSMDHEKSVVRGMNESLIKFYFLSAHQRWQFYFLWHNKYVNILSKREINCSKTNLI